MTAIVSCRLEPRFGLPWAGVAGCVRDQLRVHGVAPRDAVVLVPFAALIEPLRGAFAAEAGWQPRVETVQTLVASLGPGEDALPGHCSGDLALDRLQALEWLARLDASGGGRSEAASLMAEAAVALLLASAAQPPAGRAAWQARVLQALPSPGDGVGALEAALLRAAAAWAADAPAPASDRLYTHRPAAWVVVRLGGGDPLAEAVLQSADGLCLRVDLDADPDDPFAPVAGAPAPEVLRADDFESEAWASAQVVLQALAQGRERVALVALDRALVRRIVVLLQRQGLPVSDETGWKLSTTAAAGRVLARLRAALPQAGGDDRLDWLKRWPPAQARPRALAALEVQWRQGRNARLDAAARAAADTLWAEAGASLDPWQHGGPWPLSRWLHLLRDQLEADGDARELRAEAAGARLLQALQVEDLSTAWQQVLHRTRVDLAAFVTWFEELCESITVQVPPRPQARVVVTPLPRSIGRPFDCVVMPGADARHWAPGDNGPALIGDALAQHLGLPTLEDHRSRMRLALAQLARQSRLVVLSRRSDAGAEQAPAPDVLSLRSRWQVEGRPVPEQEVQLPHVDVPADPARPPQPALRPDLLSAWPRGLSASAVEAFRSCPYRFFSRVLLRLREPDEVDAPAEKRDFGDWLHAALHRFHERRLPDQDDERALLQAADHALAELGLDPADMLPFRAGLPAFARAYLHWLGGHEAQGWHWDGGEQPLEREPEAWAPQRLVGRIDRVDRHGSARLIVDYKTGTDAGLRERLKDPQEDVQLPYYAALLGVDSPDEPVQGGYLALDEADGPRWRAHPELAAHAVRMVAHLGGEWRRVLDGAPLQALGAGDLCDHCEARGLCRRDEWSRTS